VAHIYVVRHAKAGERRLWDGEDIDRPLSKKGWKQSEMIGQRLAAIPATSLFSSPYVRCIQTLEPLAERLGSKVNVEQRLCEHEPYEPVLELLSEIPGGSVLCSHGDIIPEVVKALDRRGTEFRAPTDWRKAAVWVMKRNKSGKIVHATVWPPPVL
jgi:8-oxo-dGTP diphosphatase